jgi:proteasome lid subunit RPN8/RPN11
MKMREEKDIKLIISQEILTKMIRCVEKAQPHEACGFIFGKVEEIENPNQKNDYFYHYKAKEFECIESNKKSPVAFIINNEERLNELFMKAREDEELNLISIFHSHPSGNFPSGTDERNMKRLNNKKLITANAIWVIMDASNKELNSFLLLNDDMLHVDTNIKH